MVNQSSFSDPEWVGEDRLNASDVAGPNFPEPGLAIGAHCFPYCTGLVPNVEEG